jgi:acetylornithine/succinyldiaminopimelate/putrescine aminotransferase
VALEILAIIEEEGLGSHIGEMGEHLKKGLGKLGGKGWVGEVRGFGGMVGVTVQGRSHAEVAEALAKQGLLVVPAGSDVLRFLPPYSVTNKEVEDAIKKVEATL